MSLAIASLRQPARVRVVARYVGLLAMVWAALIAVPMAVAFRTGQSAVGVRYLIIIAIAAGGGLMLSRLHIPKRIRMNEAMIIGCALFVLAPLALTAPLTAMGLPWIDALFEAVSGVTTTGLSTTGSVRGASDVFVFARSWDQWYGGLGILALALALVTHPGAMARRLSLSEHYTEGGLGSSRTQFRSTLTIYAGITVIGAALVWLAGAGWFHGLLYALSSVSTGGFSPHDASLAGLGGPPLHITVILLCTACAVPFAIYGYAVRGHWRDVVADPQVKTLLVAGAIMAALVTLSMWLAGGRALADAAIEGPVMALSAQTTSGFSSVDVGSLDGGSKLLLICAMAVGGSAGSTAGGIKLLRALILLRMLQGLFTRMSLPKHVVYEPRVGGKHVDRDEISEAITVVALFATTVLVSWLCFVAAGYDPLDSLFEVTSATGTVGLSTGIASPELPAALKLVLCADMILGRVEMIALVVVLWPRTWLPKHRRTA